MVNLIWPTCASSILRRKISRTAQNSILDPITLTLTPTLPVKLCLRTSFSFHIVWDKNCGRTSRGRCSHPSLTLRSRSVATLPVELKTRHFFFIFWLKMWSSTSKLIYRSIPRFTYFIVDNILDVSQGLRTMLHERCTFFLYGGSSLGELYTFLNPKN